MKLIEINKELGLSLLVEDDFQFEIGKIYTEQCGNSYEVLELKGKFAKVRWIDSNMITTPFIDDLKANLLKEGEEPFKPDTDLDDSLFCDDED